MTEVVVTQADIDAAIDIRNAWDTNCDTAYQIAARHRTLTPAQTAPDEAMHFDWSSSTDAEIIAEVAKLEPLVSPHRNACLIQEMRRRFEAAQAAGPVLLEADVEIAAKAIFEHWQFRAPVPWVECGNSDKQHEARAYARAAISAITQAEGPQA